MANTHIIQHWALRFVLLLLLAMPWLYGAGLQPFFLGIWYQSEPVTLALYLAAAMLVLPLAWLLVQIPGFWRMPLVFPALGWPLSWVLLGVILLLAAPIPNRSLYGTAETGEGILWWLVVAILALGYSLLWPQQRFRRLLLISALLSAYSMALLNVVLPDGHGWRPARWPDHAAFTALYLVMIGIMVLRWEKPMLRRWGKIGQWFVAQPWRLWLLAWLLAMPVMASSSSWAGMALFFVALPLGLIIFQIIPLQFRWRGQQLLLLATPVIVTVLIILAGLLGADGSVWSRGVLNNIGLIALFDKPSLLLLGQGWGGFNDILFQYAYSGGARNFIGDVWMPNWEGLGAGAFHSHNGWLEALIANGIIGGLLFLLLPVWLLRATPKTVRLPIALLWMAQAALASLWFQLAFVLPFMAAAMVAATTPVRGAALVRRVRPSLIIPPRLGQVPPRYQPSYGAYVAALLITLGLAVAAYQHYQLAQRGARALALIQEPYPADMTPYQALFQDDGRGGIHLWWAINNYNRALASAVQQGYQLSEHAVRWYALLFDLVDSVANNPRQSLRLRAMPLELRNELVYIHSHSALSPIRDAMLPTWAPHLLRVLEFAPHRSDMAVQIFIFLMASNQKAQVLELANAVQRILPDDIISQWFQGLVWLEDPTTEAKGLCQVVRAYDADVGRFFPISPQLISAIESERPNYEKNCH